MYFSGVVSQSMGLLLSQYVVSVEYSSITEDSFVFKSFFSLKRGSVMYKTIFVINIIIYMCVQHSDVLLILNCGFPIFEEENLLPKEFAPFKQVVYSFKGLLKEKGGGVGWCDGAG